jgi:uncharacterized protein HemX
MEAKIAVLEKKLADEISSNKSLIRQKDGIIRQKNEEIDRLAYHNEMLTKRVSSSQRDLKKSSSMWSLKSYLEPVVDRTVETDLVLKELQSKMKENGLIAFSNCKKACIQLSLS